MATLDDILTTQKNGVVAINNLNQSLTAFYDKYAYVSGQYRSATITSRTEVARGSGRLIAMNIVIAGAAGGIYDEIVANVTLATGDGSKATVSFTPAVDFTVGDTIFVTGVDPSGYNNAGVNPVTDVVSSTSVKYVNATTTAYVSGGFVFNKKASELIIVTPASVGITIIGAPFTKGLVIDPGAGQSVNVTYSLD
jgi:hypothetical protein